MPKFPKRSFHLRALAALGALALAAALAGCPKGPKVITKRLPGGPKESKVRVSVQVDGRANDGNPVALDLLLVADKELLEQLQGMSAEQWFEKRAQILLDQPKKGTLAVSQWEWSPGQVVPATEMRVAPEVRAAIIFARYYTPGEHRAVLDPRKDVRLTLGETTLAVTQPKR